MSQQVQTFPLWNADGTIKYVAPDGRSYSFKPSDVVTDNQWHVLERDSRGKPVMALRKYTSTKDAELAVSIEGAISRSATLLHDEDDFPRDYICATDAYNDDNPLGRAAFKLVCKGEKNSPVPKNAAFKIMVVG